MSTPQSAIVAAGVGAFFLTFRFAIDIIAEASAKKSVDDDDDSDSKKLVQVDVKDNINGALAPVNPASTIAVSVPKSAEIPSLVGPTIERRPTRLLNGRLSVANLYTSHRKRFNTARDDNIAASSLESQTPEGEGIYSPRTTLERSLPRISLLVQVPLFLYFLVATILTSAGNDTPAFRDALYRGIPLGCAAVGTFVNILTSVFDYKRIRFSSVQRMLYALGTIIMLLGCIILLFDPSSAAPPSSSGKPTPVDYTTLAALLCYTLLAIVEGRACRYPNPPADNAAGKKARLTKKAIILILKPYFWPAATDASATVNRILAALTWVCVIASKACSLTSPVLLGKASTALSQFNFTSCIRYVIAYACLQFAGNFFKEGQNLVYLKVAQAAFVQLSEVAFHHLHSLSLDWHLKKKLGEVIRSMDRGILACDTLMKYLFLWLVPAIAECILVCVIFATYFHYFPLAVSIFMFVFVYIVWTIVVTLWRKKFRKSVAQSDNDWHDKCTDSLINFETVKYFTAEKYEMERFGKAIRKFQSGTVNVQASLSFLNISQQLILQACLATSLTLATFGIRQRMNCCVDNGCGMGDSECCSALGNVCTGMEVGDFVAVLTYTLNLFMPLNFLGSVYNAIVMAAVDLQNLSELLAESPDVTDAPDAMPLPKSNEYEPDTAVEFDNVVFHYPSQPETKGLKGMSFKMKKGTTTAIVGTTGAGKTTVSRLFFRFYDVVGGAVKINGVDVRSVTQKSLREAIGVVPQATSMFNDTLRMNIQYGNRKASDAELERVCKDAQLWNFVESLPEKWETMVGDRGLKLSGGEKQRTAIARCLLKDPPFVILDEATSALDTVTENSVQEALDSLGSERTCLVIAHRLGTIRNADNIIVLDDGVVIEQGTHEELLSHKGKYAEMWNMQLHSTRNTSTSNLVLLSQN